VFEGGLDVEDASVRGILGGSRFVGDDSLDDGVADDPTRSGGNDTDEVKPV
jgi:hypothetical protein